MNMATTGTVRKWRYRINGQEESPLFSTKKDAEKAAHDDFIAQCNGLTDLESAHVKCYLMSFADTEEFANMFFEKVETVWLSYRKGGDCLECGESFKDNSKWWPCCSSKCATEHYN